MKKILLPNTKNCEIETSNMPNVRMLDFTKHIIAQATIYSLKFTIVNGMKLQLEMLTVVELINQRKILSLNYCISL